MRAVRAAIFRSVTGVCGCARSVASVCCRRAISRFVALMPACRSCRSTCSPVIVPSAERRATASCTCWRGIFSVRSAVPLFACVEACTEMGKPPSDVAMRSARLTAAETAVGLATRSERAASYCTRRPRGGTGANAFGSPAVDPAAPTCAWSAGVRAGAPSLSSLSSARSGVVTTTPCTTRCWWSGRVKTIAAAIAAATGRVTTSARRQVNFRGGAVSAAAIRRTCSRTSSGAVTRDARSSAARSRCDTEGLLELLERAVEARGDVGRRDAEDARGAVRVHVEHDAQRDDLALAGVQRTESGLQVGGEPFGEALLVTLGHGGELLAPRAPPLRAEVVERGRARDLEEPGAGRAALGVEAVPEPQRALERLAREVGGRGAVAREPGQVAVHVVQVLLCRLREGHLARSTPPGGRASHPGEPGSLREPGSGVSVTVAARGPPESGSAAPNEIPADTVPKGHDLALTPGVALRDTPRRTWRNRQAAAQHGRIVREGHDRGLTPGVTFSDGRGAAQIVQRAWRSRSFWISSAFGPAFSTPGTSM